VISKILLASGGKIACRVARTAKADPVIPADGTERLDA